MIPNEALQELKAFGSPPSVLRWATDLPEWVEIRNSDDVVHPELQSLDAGEAAAIQLASTEHDSLLLIDDNDGRIAAAKLGIPYMGTLGILKLGAQSGLVVLKDAIEALRNTNFRASDALLRSLLL